MTEATYDAIAEWYDQSIRKCVLLSANDLITSTFFNTIGNIEGQTICDLACGQGDMARQMARQGAKVVGVDISRKLLEIAQREEASQPLGITYRHDDVQALSFPEGTLFDGVLCNLALMDIPDVTSTFRNVQRILRPEGWFVFSITHPCFQMPPHRSYYEEGFWRSDNPQGVRGRVGAFHRTLSTYVNSLAQAGLFVERMIEPQLSNREMPVVLVTQCRSAIAYST